MKTPNTHSGSTASSQINIFRKDPSLSGKRSHYHEVFEQLQILICLRVKDVPGFRINSCMETALGWTNEDARSESFLEQLFDKETGDSDGAFIFQLSDPGWKELPCRTKSGKSLQITWRMVHLGDGVQMALGVDDSGLTARQSTLEAEKKHALDLNRAKSELIANVSHEILNPLNSIMGFSEILENELEDNFYRGCASTIRENGRFLLEIMNDLMDVTRIENNRLPLLLEAVNPWDIILSVRDLMQILARDKNLPLIVQRDENAPESIVTEPKRLRQILINLVGNGIKFTESGSITIRLGRLLDEDPQGFQIDVIDTGIGIQSEEMDNLFEAFVRGSNHKSAGAGLGLSICRKLSRHLQGELILESTVGQGSKFTLKLPVLCKEV